MLIVLEGIDGAGTTSQSKRLVERLEADSVHAHWTREPSDGPIGRLIRDSLSAPTTDIHQTAYSLLFAADRVDHVKREVEPALAEGKVVVSDRWYHSSLAYQAAGEERDWIWQVNGRARTPDLTIYLEVSPHVAAARRAAAGRPHEAFDDDAFQTQVAKNYRAVNEWLGKQEQIVIIDGEASFEDVSDKVFSVVTEARKNNS